MAFFKNIFISTFLTFSFLTVQASAESRFMLNDAMISTGMGQCEDGVCEVIYDTPEKRPSPQPYPEVFPTGEEHHPIMICQDGSIAHDCSHVGPKTGGASPPPPEEIFPELFRETGGDSIACTGVYREDGSDNCRITLPEEPIIVIDCAPGYILNGKNCVPIEGTTCTVSGTCTTGPVEPTSGGGGSGGTGVSEPALPAILLTMLGLGFWVRRRK